MNEISETDFFEEIQDIDKSNELSPRQKTNRLYAILKQVCYEQTKLTAITFSGLVSRLHYICEKIKATEEEAFAIQELRRYGFHQNINISIETYNASRIILYHFICLCYGKKNVWTSASHNTPSTTATSHYPYIRLCIESIDEHKIKGIAENIENKELIINLDKSGYDGDLNYISKLAKKGDMINLLKSEVNEEGEIQANTIVLCPDYLLDISSIAKCFREYGHHHYNYLINTLQARASSPAIVLGNLASMMLDNYIHHDEHEPSSYNKVITKFFPSAALDLCACKHENTLKSDFHSNASTQMENIKSIINNQLSSIEGFEKDKMILEASFICEALGLQGRVDMMKDDMTILVEQKSGKKDEYRNTHKEDHLIQALLYHGVMNTNFGLSANNIKTFLLYSKYADGLIFEKPINTLLREAIKLRNEIVADELSYATGNIEDILNSLSAQNLNLNGLNSRFWETYFRNPIDTMLDSLRNHSSLERAYFNRFFTFIYKEQQVAKIGSGNPQTRGIADLWNLTTQEKLDTGNIILGLKLIAKEKSSDNNGYDILRLAIPKESLDNSQPNFRLGDMIILYTYEKEADVRRNILMKGFITKLMANEVTINLRNGQQNKNLMGNESDVFAIEHDASDSMTSNAVKGLCSFLNANQERRMLLLGTTMPRTNPQIKLAHNYGTWNELILKEKQASDYFLLVGPPGTGKTSHALQYMVKEELSEPNANILLMSYTNRAVDEICEMLIDSGITDTEKFIRVGNATSCEERFRDHCIQNVFRTCNKLSEVEDIINNTRIFVGTTSSISSSMHLLFKLKKFHLAIIDEASQILETNIIPLLSARYGEENAIEKFVLVGDYKQLPAVVQQSEEESRVENEELRRIGLTNCRNSLFERLYNLQDSDSCRGILRAQGRMHPDIAYFPNKFFYNREKLRTIPLPHQEGELFYKNMPCTDWLDNVIANRRFAFIDLEEKSNPLVSDKSNIKEAKMVASIAERIFNAYGDKFDSLKTLGVIVPYRNQISMVKREIENLGIDALMDITVDTVERYQGSQRNVIIYSFTVKRNTQLDFLTSNTFIEDGYVIDRKLNVAITRAREQIFMLGNAKLLSRVPIFKELIDIYKV